MTPHLSMLAWCMAQWLRLGKLLILDYALNTYQAFSSIDLTNSSRVWISLVLHSCLIHSFGCVCKAQWPWMIKPFISANVYNAYLIFLISECRYLTRNGKRLHVRLIHPLSFWCVLKKCLWYFPAVWISSWKMRRSCDISISCLTTVAIICSSI